MLQVLQDQKVSLELPELSCGFSFSNVLKEDGAGPDAMMTSIPLAAHVTVATSSQWTRTVFTAYL